MATTTLSIEKSTDLLSARVDKAVFIPAIILVLLVSAGLLFFPEQAARISRLAMNFVTSRLGWLFVFVGMGALVFALWLALGPYGQIKLGDVDDPPEFSTLSWVAMMFTAGIGVGLVSWGFAEPIFYLLTPPMGIEPHSARAAEWAHMYTLFHWGLVPWALYAIPAVPIAYMLYVRKEPILRMGAACRHALPPATRIYLMPLIDTLVIIGLIGGAGTSIGLGVPLVSAFASELFHIPNSFWTKIGVLTLWTMIFGTSVYRGLKGGIRILSDINILLAVAVVIFILFAGPTVFILSLTANSFGLLINNFARMGFWLDPIKHSGFPEAWTLFYWAWWIAYAPMMGLFFGRISRGRTIKQLVLGVIGWGSLGCCLFMAISGGYAIYLDINGLYPVSATLSEKGMSLTVVQVILQLPYARICLFIFTVLTIIFLATTLDSAAYVLASISTKNLRGDQEPHRNNRLVWALALALVSVGILVTGGLKTVKTASVLSAVPLIPIIFLMILSLLKCLRDDFGAVVSPPVLALKINSDGSTEVKKLANKSNL